MCFKKEVLECWNYSVRHCVTPSIFCLRCISFSPVWQNEVSLLRWQIGAELFLILYLHAKVSSSRVWREKTSWMCKWWQRHEWEKNPRLSHTTAGLDRLNKQTFDFLLATAAFSRYAKNFEAVPPPSGSNKAPFPLSGVSVPSLGRGLKAELVTWQQP